MPRTRVGFRPSVENRLRYLSGRLPDVEFKLGLPVGRRAKYEIGAPNQFRMFRQKPVNCQWKSLKACVRIVFLPEFRQRGCLERADMLGTQWMPADIRPRESGGINNKDMTNAGHGLISLTPGKSGGIGFLPKY